VLSTQLKRRFSMKGNKINWVAVVVLALVMAFPLALVLQGQMRRFPNITAAMESLRTARNHLSQAGNNFGGHRAAALAATDNAIRECQEAIRWARHH
jgi:hypothetical protein